MLHRPGPYQEILDAMGQEENKKLIEGARTGDDAKRQEINTQKILTQEMVEEAFKDMLLRYTDPTCNTARLCNVRCLCYDLFTHVGCAWLQNGV